ncbi:MAG TPA: NADH-quinone oxidoreductase subunit L, partial [Rhodocyclaceae bacterium]|nr:NADH-quinone oxidoreductase subunit L [Rhodocyclaceae bacterium]
MDMKTIYLLIPLTPLAGAIIAGFFSRTIGRSGAHSVTILGVLVSFLLSLAVMQDVLAGHTFNGPVYTWLESGGLKMEIGFLVDRLTAVMLVVVTFVSLMVHVYTIGYMAHDEDNWPADSKAGTHSYQRFFAYISLFTFSMLMLVMS